MSEKIGRLLQTTREKKSVSIKQASLATFIKPFYITALESGRFETMPSRAQAMGFLRSYALFLGIEHEVDTLLNEPVEPQPTGEKNQPLIVETTTRTPRSVPADYKEIGNEIRQRRELLEIELEEAETHTHIPVHYLKLMENGEFNRFPSPVQSRGMLNMYCDFLGLPSEQILLKYAESIQERFLENHPEIKEKSKHIQTKLTINKPTMPLWVKGVFSKETALILFIALAAISFGIWGLIKVNQIQRNEGVVPTVPALANLLLPSATPSLTPNPTQPGADETTDGETTGEGEIGEGNPEGETATGNVRVTLVIHERTFLRVIVDGEEQLNNRVKPNENLLFSGDQEVEILSGSGSAVEVYLDDTSLGRLGNYGQVVDVVVNSQGFVVPTPTPSLTPSPTSPAVPTATPTPES